MGGSSSSRRKYRSLEHCSSGLWQFVGERNQRPSASFPTSSSSSSSAAIVQMDAPHTKNDAVSNADVDIAFPSLELVMRSAVPFLRLPGYALLRSCSKAVCAFCNAALRHFRIDYHGRDFTSRDASLLARLLQSMIGLQSLEMKLCYCSLEEGMEAILKSTAQLIALGRLSIILIAARIGDAGLSSLVQAVLESNTFGELEVEVYAAPEPAFTETTARSLVCAVLSRPNLCQFRFRIDGTSTGAGTGTAEALADGLAASSHLTVLELELSRSDVEDLAVDALEVAVNDRIAARGFACEVRLPDRRIEHDIHCVREES